MLLNKDRLHARMAELQLDAVIATTPENVTYTSGFWALPQWIRRGPQAYVVWPAPGKGEAEIVTSTATLDLVADQQIWVERVRRYGAFHVDGNPDAKDPVSQRLIELQEAHDHGDALSALVAGITDAGLSRARIGIDEIGLMPGQLEALRERLPGASLVPAAGLFRNARAVKTPEEIARLARVAEIAERSIKAALGVAREGVSEVELARAFHAQTVQDDAFPVLGCIGFGERSALMNVQPSDRRLRQGNVIRFDVGGRYRHYRADIARIATFGEPSEEVRRYHRALLAGVERACELIRPGARVADVFEAAVETVRREGIGHYRRNHVGHGIGIDGYDAPSLTATSDEIIEAGMVLCVETPYYELGRWGLQVEDMVVVRADGVERLMATSGDLIVVAP
ncbi:M24 family metallopeptidase [Chelativorans intermedius]|uniref:M24 family metallopeptidase n=1 Tax=Chelativorans intermedius TaxID=515947 RepID=A0ABV6DAV2_9HYPH|nr:Xaa-Pro peptidase family protein [Chelativorans intermedius]MCT9000171.1 Xaa-Pro peptidase family protein [Chelativorans intermedius]